MKRRPRRARAGRRTGDAAVRDETETPTANSGSLREWIKSIVVAAVLFLVLRTFLIQTFVIISGSMKPTLLVGDMLVVNRAALGSKIPLVGVRVPGIPRRAAGTSSSSSRLPSTARPTEVS